MSPTKRATTLLLPSRFLGKLYAGYALLILLMAGIVFGLIARELEQQGLRELDQRLFAEATFLGLLAKPWLTSTNPKFAPELQAQVQTLGSELAVRLTVIRADGTVLADSREDPRQIDNQAGQPEILAWTRAGPPVPLQGITRGIGERGERLLALTVETDGSVRGWVRAALPLAVLAQRTGPLQRAVLVGTLLVMGIALVLGFLLARRITEPLQAMTAAVEALAAGSYGQRIAISSRDELGQLAMAWNAMSDQLQAAIATIQADRARLTAILRSMDEGVVAVDAGEHIVHLNPAAGRLLGIAPEKALGQPIWQVTRWQQIATTIQAAMHQGQLVAGEVRRVGAQDQVIELRAFPLQNSAETPAGAVLLLADVTSLRQLETMRQDFVGNVSHELKTPVTAIRGLVETLLTDAAIDPPTRQRFLEKIALQTERLSKLVTDLLSLSRLESARPDLELVPVDLREPVRDALRGLQPHSEARGVKLSCAMTEAPVWVLGEPNAIEQAATNLIENAINYSARGQEVQVRVESERDQAILAVEDHGIGIALHDQQRIFERFYRVDRARSRDVGGTGLGLAIVKHIALTLGGSVAVESRLGEGSTFRIRLPLHRPE